MDRVRLKNVPRQNRSDVALARSRTRAWTGANTRHKCPIPAQRLPLGRSDWIGQRNIGNFDSVLRMKGCHSSLECSSLSVEHVGV